MKYILIYGTAVLIFFGCGTKNKTNEALLMEQSDSSVVGVEKMTDKLIGEIMQSIPSPIETSELIKSTGEQYNPSLLNPTENAKKNYHSNFDKAINLGVYGTDLGYINIYNQSKDALFYLNCIQALADELKIGQFFDYHTFKRMADNNNMDSLLYLSTSNFEKMNDFLFEKKRSDQSVLILTGGWVEALYISCKVVQTQKNEELIDKIADQKIVLDQLILLLSHFEDENIKKLNNELKVLQTSYSQIKIVTNYKESQMEEINGVYIINDKSESHSEMTDEQLKGIEQKVESIRAKIIL